MESQFSHLNFLNTKAKNKKQNKTKNRPHRHLSYLSAKPVNSTHLPPQ